MKAGKIIAAVLAVLLGLVAMGMLVGGGALMWAHTTQRDADGFIESPTYALESAGYAVTSGDVDLAARPGDWWPGDLADVRFEAESVDSEAAVFVGIGPSDDVDSYLDGVARDEVTRLGRADDVEYRSFSGTAPAALPGNQNFWVASAEGAGTQVVTWDVAAGEWSVVVMNAAADPGVRVDVTAGARIGILLAVGIGLLVVGLILGIIAAALLVWAVSPARRDLEEPAVAVPAAAPVGRYPLIIEGRLDPELSRWLWLVKWLLAIPHFIVLVFLWVAFVLLTFAAFFAILFTGRYPRGIFDFNVGVLRWTWRVSYYSYSTLGTDEYPPFTLQNADYPARLDVAYPEELSRGLVLVKWWLLAIPHYIIVGLFTSGLVWWTADFDGDSVLELGGGLIGLLVLIAALALLFTARYPRGLFDLIMGLNRWVYRVWAYAALMRDEYPPFRLDVGGREEG
ncbi:MAG: DUF4389 domain-containing protein [Acidimicrobiia bacterium]|nr:DUF4389 domain-containing protein [Acidimicrobiia bacterium]